MVSKNLPMGIENCDTSQMKIFGGYVKVRESLYTRVIIWVHTILNHIDTRAIWLGLKVLAWYIDPNGIWIFMLIKKS